jgi:hypothetical protein
MRVPVHELNSAGTQDIDIAPEEDPPPYPCEIDPAVPCDEVR